MARVNLTTIAFSDGVSANGAWTSETTGCGSVRKIRHYGVLMMQIQLDPTRPGWPFRILTIRDDNELTRSDKCGISRIRKSMLKS